MPPEAKDSFVLFDVGHDESMLRLGDLVLYNYNDPLAVRHYTCQKLPEEKAIASTRMDNFTVFHKHGPQAGIQLEAAGFINLGVTLSQESGRLVIAKSAERVVLRNPTEYLRDVVLADKLACEALSLWSSASRTDRILKFKWARRPKIWMMTGMYLFEGAKLVTVRSQTGGVEVGISSEVVTALTTVPVGGSISSSKATSAEVSMEVPDRKVWAAQYQLLNARYVNQSQPAGVDAVSTITLYPDIRSRGRLRNSSTLPEELVVEGFDDHAVVPEESPVGLSINGASDDDPMEEHYLDSLEEMIRLYEAELESGSSTEAE